MIQFGKQEFIFVGLGNPGEKYANTRHNIGYIAIRAFAQQMGWQFKEEKRYEALVAKGVAAGHDVHLLLPLTYMNLSGRAVRKYLDFFKLDPTSLVVVVDEIALPFGQLRLKAMGSAGGHNGLKSVEAYLGTTAYMRLRMGIGHPGEKILSNYVLDPFSPEELKELESFVNQSVEVLQRLFREEAAQVMNTVNTKMNRLNKPPILG